MVSVRKVNTLRGDARREVCYVGRAFAGWPQSPWGNVQRLGCSEPFRAQLLARPDLAEHLAALWEACEHGRLPLGCWRLDWHGIGECPPCNAAVYAELLNQRFKD